MLPEMVRSHKLPAALMASMWSVSGVYPHMSSELIRTEERPCTAVPLAFIGPLTWGGRVRRERERIRGIRPAGRQALTLRKSGQG